MDREILWISNDEKTIEHLRVKIEQADVIEADGWIIHAGTDSYRIHYRITCDAKWRVRKLEMIRDDDASRSIALQSNGAGRWSDERGTDVPALAGCIDVDIRASPFTNTIPIRRINLLKRQSQTIRVAFVNLPDLTVKAVEQRYTLLDLSQGGMLVRYEGLESGFTVELPVDADGLVIDYPGFFRRIWSR